jgi:hypothetical protein
VLAAAGIAARAAGTRAPPGMAFSSTVGGAVQNGHAPNCSAVIDVKHCNCTDNVDGSMCAEFRDFCVRDKTCPHHKRCQMDPRKGGMWGSCVDDVACADRSEQDCVCFQSTGTGTSECMWSAKANECTLRQPWDDGSRCGGLAHEECTSHIGAFDCSWGTQCTFPCGGRGGGPRCCKWEDRCFFASPPQPACEKLSEPVKATASTAAQAVPPRPGGPRPSGPEVIAAVSDILKAGAREYMPLRHTRPLNPCPGSTNRLTVGNPMKPPPSFLLLFFFFL